jgi:alpha-D-xyloside xylohydrolase
MLECTGTLYFPKGANWADVFTGKVTKGGQTVTVAAPLDTIPVYTRQ